MISTDLKTEENNLFRMIIPKGMGVIVFLSGVIISLAFTVYKIDQSRQNDIISDLQKHEIDDNASRSQLVTAINILNSNVFQVCQKTQAACQPVNNLTASLLSQK